MRRIGLVVLATVGFAAIAAVSFNAVGAHGAGPGERFTVFEHQVAFGARIADPTKGPTVGDSFALSSDLYTDQSLKVKVGQAGVSCTWSSITNGTQGETECNFTVLLTGGPFGRGQVSTAGLVDAAAATTPGGKFVLPIVGGSGDFHRAGGEVSIAVISSIDSWDTFKVVDLAESQK